MPAMSGRTGRDRLPELQGLPGFCTPEKAHWLYETAAALARRLPHAPSAVELGVHGGRSLLAIALGFLDGRRGTVVGVDAYDPAAACEGVEAQDPCWQRYWREGLDYEALHRGAVEAIGRFGVADHATIWRDRTDRAAGRLRPDSIDLLHVDGNHSEAASLRDVLAWLPVVQPGGLVVLDDTDWPSTQRAVAVVAARALLVHRERQWEVYQVQAPALPRHHETPTTMAPPNPGP